MTTEFMDLEEELPRRERRRLMTPVGVGAIAVVIAAAGFFGGVHVQKSRGGTAGAGAAAGRFAGARAGGFGAAGGATAGGARGGAGAGAAGGAGAGAGAAGGGAGAVAAGGGAGAAGGGAGAGATVGSVSSVDGQSIYVDDSSGNTVRVRLAKGGTVTRTAKAAATAIHPGDTVIVQGETASSGTVVASTIRATASNAAGALGGFGGFGGGAPGAQGTPGGG